MSEFFLRICKRYASVEEGFEEFYRTEFFDRQNQPDLSLSAFLIEERTVPQTQAEFAASYRNAPPGRRYGLSLVGCDGFEPKEDPAKNFLFTYGRTRHHDLRFTGPADLRRMAERVFAELGDRQQETPLPGIQTYVKQRLDAHDEEWEALVVAKPGWKKWALKAPPRPGALRGDDSTPKKTRPKPASQPPPEGSSDG